MKKKKYEVQFRWGLTAMGVVAFYFLILRWESVSGILDKIKSILMPIIIGLFIAFLLDSLVDILETALLSLIKSEKRKGLCRGIGILLCEAFMITAIAFLFSMIIPELINSITTFISNLDSYVSTSESFLQPFLEEYPQVADSFWEAYENILGQIEEFFNNDVMTLVLSVSNSLKNVGNLFYNLIVGVVVSFYFLAGKERLVGIFKKLLYTFLKTEVADGIVNTVSFSVQIFKGFFVGKIWDSLIIGIICFVGLSILKMPYALLVSIVVGVTNIIPYFGPFIGALPSALLILMVDPMKCLIFLIFILILQQVDGNLIGPKILGNQTGVSSLGVLFTILLGGGLFGVAGMVLCVPTYAVICRLLDAYCEYRLEGKNLPLRASEYVDVKDLALMESEEEEEEASK